MLSPQISHAQADAGLPACTPAEELANFLTHGFGLVLSVFGLGFLVSFAWLHGDPWHRASAVVYGLSLVLLYGASTGYHGCRTPHRKRLWRFLDHVAIYLLIAGTYTPFTLVSLRGRWGWALFAAVWALALLGVLHKLRSNRPFALSSTVSYLAMGWLALLAARPMMEALPPAALGWLVAGGFTYTAGYLFFRWERLPYHHAVWHLFVLAGSACHFIAVFRYVVPPV